MLPAKAVGFKPMSASRAVPCWTRGRTEIDGVPERSVRGIGPKEKETIGG